MLGTIHFNLDIMPTPLDTFSAMFLICIFQSRDSSIMTPRNDNDFTHWMILLFAEIESISLGTLLFLERKITFFSWLRSNLLLWNQTNNFAISSLKDLCNANACWLALIYNTLIITYMAKRLLNMCHIYFYYNFSVNFLQSTWIRPQKIFQTKILEVTSLVNHHPVNIIISKDKVMLDSQC